MVLDRTVSSGLGQQLVSVLCTETLSGGNDTTCGILWRCHLLKDNTFADFDFEEVDFLVDGPHVLCTFPSALCVNPVIWIAL
jgi:hypothetical protein